MPTKKQLRELKRLERVSVLMRSIWGPGYRSLRFIGSPHEGEVVEDTESILHELAHQTLMPSEQVFSPGAMDHSFNWIGQYIDGRSLYLQDLHEIKAVAIELLVSRRMRLRLNTHGIIRFAKRNTELFQRQPVKRLEKLIRRAMRLPHIQHRADTLMVFIAEQRKAHNGNDHRKRSSPPSRQGR